MQHETYFFIGRLPCSLCWQSGRPGEIKRLHLHARRRTLLRKEQVGTPGVVHSFTRHATPRCTCLFNDFFLREMVPSRDHFIISLVRRTRAQRRASDVAPTRVTRKHTGVKCWNVRTRTAGGGSVNNGTGRRGLFCLVRLLLLHFFFLYYREATPRQRLQLGGAAGTGPAGRPPGRLGASARVACGRCPLGTSGGRGVQGADRPRDGIGFGLGNSSRVRARARRSTRWAARTEAVNVKASRRPCTCTHRARAAPAAGLGRAGAPWRGRKGGSYLSSGEKIVYIYL